MGAPVGRPKKSEYIVTDSAQHPSSFRVKTVKDDASSSWRNVKVAYIANKPSVFTLRGSARPSKPTAEVFLSGSSTPDLVLRDSMGDGWYDSVTHLGTAQPAVDASCPAPAMALDTSDDGKADTLIVDSTGDGRYDQAYNRQKAPLSFLATMARGANAGKKQQRQPSELGLSDSDMSAAEEALAPGWEKRMSKSQNSWYYFNKSSQRCTWNVSEAELPPWPNSPAKDIKLGGFEGHDDEDTGQSLAPGWERKMSQSKNRYYYCHLESGRTTWRIKEAMFSASVEHPIYWKHCGKKGPFLELVHTSSIFRHVQMLLASTFLFTRTRDRKERLPNSLEALRIWRVENSEVWRRYAVHRASLKDLAADAGRALPGCDPMPKTWELMSSNLFGANVTLPASMGATSPSSPESPPLKTLEKDINEVFLFHGTSPASALGIVDRGFDISKAAGTACYGPGAYFAECSSKSDEYACAESDGLHQGHCAMFLCRVLLGRVLHWQTEFSPELTHKWSSGAHDSILGDRLRLRGTYREFVLPPESCHGAYPEYLIVYRRHYDD